MRQGVAEALRELRPGAKWICDGNVYSGITWLEGDGGQTIPTQAQVDSKVAELNAEASERSCKFSIFSQNTLPLINYSLSRPPPSLLSASAGCMV